MTVNDNWLDLSVKSNLTREKLDDIAICLKESCNLLDKLAEMHNPYLIQYYRLKDVMRVILEIKKEIEKESSLRVKWHCN